MKTSAPMVNIKTTVELLKIQGHAYKYVAARHFNLHLSCYWLLAIVFRLSTAIGEFGAYGEQCALNRNCFFSDLPDRSCFIGRQMSCFQLARTIGGSKLTIDK